MVATIRTVGPLRMTFPNFGWTASAGKSAEKATWSGDHPDPPDRGGLRDQGIHPGLLDVRAEWPEAVEGSGWVAAPHR